MTPFPAQAAVRTSVPAPQTLFQHWLAFAILMLFAAYVLWQFGVWHMLLGADPTMLTLVILVVFASSTLWCGHRAWTLGRQLGELLQFTAMLSEAARVRQWLAAPPVGDNWIHDYFNSLWCKGRAHWRENAQLTDLLAEKAHGPHESAWWVNGIQLKLGLLGKVIGFSVLALQIGSMESFDASQSQALLKNLTGGLGIALLTTMAGLVGNILLGIQLTRLDRAADALVAHALALAERELAVLFAED